MGNGAAMQRSEQHPLRPSSTNDGSRLMRRQPVTSGRREPLNVTDGLSVTGRTYDGYQSAHALMKLPYMRPERLLRNGTLPQ